MLRGALIGFGRMGITHYSILNTHPNVQFVAVCDSLKPLLNGLKRYKNIEVFTDYREMFDQARPDFAIVCTPTASHMEIGMAAMERGIHLFMEKPLTLDAKSGIDLVHHMSSKKLVNQVGYFLRFHCVFRAVKEFLQKGIIGKISHYKNEMYGRTVLHASKSSWRAEKKMGGGCMLDFGSHCIDLSDYLFGPVNKVSGSILKSIYSSEVEDIVLTNLWHDSGVVGSISVNWSDESYRRPYNRIEIYGDKGKIIADRQEWRLFLSEQDPEKRYCKGWNVGYLPEIEKGERFIVRGPEFTHQLDHFVACIQKKLLQSTCSFADAIRTDKVMDMIREDFLYNKAEIKGR
jgi:predicted dehydrogenase